MIEIIEQFIMGKQPDQTLCEDGIFISENFIAVIDGATSKGNKKWPGGLAGGGYAKELIKRELDIMPREIDRDSFFKRIDKLLYDEYCKEFDHDDRTEYLRACVMVYSDFHRQIWSIGDCRTLINGVLPEEENKGIDNIMADMRSFVINHYLVSGGKEEDLYTNDVGRAAILPFLKMQYIFENNRESSFGYPTLNGHGADLSKARTYNVSAGDTVVFSSDGYPTLHDTLEACESELKALIEEDPLCYKKLLCTKGIQQGYNSYDDRCFLKFKIGE